MSEGMQNEKSAIKGTHKEASDIKGTAEQAKQDEQHLTTTKSRRVGGNKKKAFPQSKASRAHFKHDKAAKRAKRQERAARARDNLTDNAPVRNLVRSEAGSRTKATDNSQASPNTVDREERTRIRHPFDSLSPEDLELFSRAAAEYESFTLL